MMASQAAGSGARQWRASSTANSDPVGDALAADDPAPVGDVPAVVVGVDGADPHALSSSANASVVADPHPFTPQ
jgi:hypothetical protein